jgi:hypothetical protein
MVQLLAASPHGLLPFFKLRIDLGIATREDKGVWNRLKERALQDGLIEEVSFTVGGAAAGAANADSRREAGRSLSADECSAELSRERLLGGMSGCAGMYSAALACCFRRSALRSSS